MRCEGRTGLPGAHPRGHSRHQDLRVRRRGRVPRRPDGQDAIIRKREIIGEAVTRLPEQTRARRPEIPWKQIAGMRDRLTHAYFGVDLGLVWRVVAQDLDALDAAVAAVIIDTRGRGETGGESV